MEVILFLIIISLLVAGGFLIAFFWAVKDGQYDDDYTPSMRVLIEDDISVSQTKSTHTIQHNRGDNIQDDHPNQ